MRARRTAFLVLGALGQDTASALQQVLDLGLGRFGQHAPDAGAQRANGGAHALELLGVRITPDLRGQAQGHPVVVLAQPQSRCKEP